MARAYSPLAWVAAAVVLVAAETAIADPVSVRVSPHEGYGRIVFNWPVPVPFSAQIENRQLSVQFGRTVESDFAGVPGPLRDYIGQPRLSGDGRTVTIPLTGDYQLRSFPLGSAVIVDLMGSASATGEAESPRQAAAPEQQPAPPAEGASARTGAAPAIRVRTGEHDDYGRIVFDWPQEVPYQVTRNGGQLTITFRRPARFDVSGVAPGLRNVQGARSASSAESSTVTLDVSPASGFKHFLSGSRVVVDVLDPDPNAQPAPTRSAAAPEPEPAQPEAPPSQPPQPRAEPRPRPEAQPAQPDQQTAPAAPPAAAAGAAAGAATGGGPVRLTPPAVAGAASQGQPQAAAGAPRPAPSASTDRPPSEIASGGRATRAAQAAPEGEIDTVSLRIDWTEPAAAAVFRRGSNIWLVFDRTKEIDAEGLARAGQGVVREVEQVTSRRGTFVRLETPSGVNPSIRRDGLAWIFEFKNQPLAAVTPINVKPQPSSPIGARLFMPVAEAGEALALRDPEVGDNLVVVPVIPLGHGIAERHVYPQLQVLPSGQGIVMRPRVDDLRIRSIQQGVEVSSVGTMLLSSATPSAQVPTRLGDVESLTRVLRPDVWRRARREGMSDFRRTRDDLMGQLSLAQGDQRQEKRLELATFYVASNFGYEAVGVLDAYLEQDPEAVRNPEYRFLRGVANYLMDRYPEARENLGLSVMNDIDEVEFWRAAVEAESGEMERAAPVLADKGAVFRPYPRALKVPLEMLVTRAAITLGDINLASRFLDALAQEEPTPKEIDQLAYLEGQVKLMAGDFGGAVQAFEAVEKGEHRPSIVKARVARTDTLLQLREIGPEEAIEELESMRFSWRGDKFEFDLLHKLGRLYLDIDDYRNGLRTLRQAASYFRDLAEAAQVTEEMAGAFADLYLNDAADNMPPVRAIALFDEFKELTPAGERGDEMIRKLADRLAKVDLLDRAADLLSQQVEFRLEGEQKARVGARLATIHLFNKVPEMAQEVLDKSAVAGISPELAAERRILMARALVDQGQRAEAVALLEDDESRRADLLRSEIYWQAQDWPNAAKVLDRLVRGTGARPGQPITEEQGQYLLNLAVAMTLSGNERGMLRLRADYGAAMEQTPLKDAFNLISSPDSIGLIDYRTVASRVEQVSNFSKFMASYREQLQSGPLSQLNQPNTQPPS